MEFLKRLQYKVNLIPVIAKSDTLTEQEVQRLKNNINKEIEENDIEIYQFPGMNITNPCREQFEELLELLYCTYSLYSSVPNRRP